MRIIARFAASLFAASIIIFALMRAVPGNPARVALGVNATDEAVEKLSNAMGLNKPLITQYCDWVRGLLTGHFGLSLSSKQDITAQVIDRASVSLILVGLAMLLALAFAIPAGVWLATHRVPFVSALTQLGIAVPSFLVGIILVAIFAITLGILPASGWTPPAYGLGGFLTHLILPVFSLAIVQGAMLTRYVRSAILDVAGQDYIRTARSLGISRTRAIYRHGLRNAALPVLTVAGVQLTTLIVGAVIIESVFVIPGLGTMLLDAVSVRDLTTVQTIVMLLVTFTLLVNLIIDIIYRVIDPRVHAAKAAAKTTANTAAKVEVR